LNPGLGVSLLSHTVCWRPICDSRLRLRDANSPSGNYSYAKACINLQRVSTEYILTLMLACMFVLMSYMGSWISPNAAPGRIALAVICVLIVGNNCNPS